MLLTPIYKAKQQNIRPGLSDVPLFSGSLEYVSIRKKIQFIKLKLLRETLKKMKNEKFLLLIQTKCSYITNEILNAGIDAERTFKYKWPNKQ